jgi:hypothetical protein
MQITMKISPRWNHLLKTDVKITYIIHSVADLIVCINVLPNESRVVSESSLIKNTCCTQPRMIDILSMLVVAMN